MKALDLRGKRQNEGLRLEPVADKLGIHNNTLTDIERGRIGIDMETYTKISGVIDHMADDKTREGVTVG